MNIIDHLTTPGSFVFTPKGELACIRAFNATSNEVEVIVGDIDVLDNLLDWKGNREAFEARMRREGVWRSYHFRNLRVAPDQADA